MTNYTDLIARLIARHESLYGKDAVPSCISEAADAIEALVKERDHYKAMYVSAVEELAALRKQIDELDPVAWHFSGKPLYLLEGIKK